MFKRRFDSKPFALLTLVIAACLSLFASRQGEWTLNSADFRYDMSLYFSIDPEQFTDLERYEVAAFVDDDCRGLAQRLDLPDGSACLYMRIRSNSASGEQLDFLLRDRATGETLTLKDKAGAPFPFEADRLVGMPSAPYGMTPWYDVAIEAAENGTVSAENGQYAYGSHLMIAAEPAEGHHFLGWSDGVTDNPREITVDKAISLTAYFEVSTFNLELKLDGELYELRTLPYGAPVELPEMEEREGFTFSGWSDAPATMPARDLTLEGSYAPTVYTLRLMLDGEVYKEYPTPYGTPLNREDFDGSTPPEREGHTFAGWGEVPATMPAQDLDLIGSYSVNSYLLTLMLNDQVYEVLTVAYGTPLELPVPPEQEGQWWDGWDNAPATMPAHDITLTGDYEFHGYSLTLNVDGQLYEMKTILYGQPIELPEMTEREGHTFSGWGEVPAKMPARDLEFSAVYTPNLYKLTLRIGGVVYKEEEVIYGAELSIPDPEEHEGFTFTGWGDVLKTMPAHDLTLDGNYLINSYILTLMVDDATYEMLSLPFGQPIELPEMPEREGYTFSGWSEGPAQMPARDVTFTASYAINSYRLTLYIDGEVYSESLLHYGQTIELPQPEAPEGLVFTGWEGELPQAMPAHDVEIHGRFDELTGVAAIAAAAPEAGTVYSLDGLKAGQGADLPTLAPGIYILNGKAIIVK